MVIIMEIKTTEKIIGEMDEAWKMVHGRQSTDYPNAVLNNAVDITKTDKKKWVSVDDVLKFIEEFPALHYSSMGRDRQMADEVTQQFKKDILN